MSTDKITVELDVSVIGTDYIEKIASKPIRQVLDLSMRIRQEDKDSCIGEFDKPHLVIEESQERAVRLAMELMRLPALLEEKEKSIKANAIYSVLCKVAKCVSAQPDNELLVGRIKAVWVTMMPDSLDVPMPTLTINEPTGLKRPAPPMPGIVEPPTGWNTPPTDFPKTASHWTVYANAGSAERFADKGFNLMEISKTRLNADQVEFTLTMRRP